MKATAMKSRTASCLVVSIAVTLFVCNLSARAGLQIDKAYCGAAGSWRDVTTFLQHQVMGDGLSVNVSQPFETIGGDPASGRVKNLLIDYHFNGKPFRLLLEEQYPIAFTITLPSSDALPPGADARASAIMAEVSAHPALDGRSLWQYGDHYREYLALCVSLIAIICSSAALVQMRQIKRQLRKA
jgi:hypothetical protein